MTSGGQEEREPLLLPLRSSRLNLDDSEKGHYGSGGGAGCKRSPIEKSPKSRVSWCERRRRRRLLEEYCSAQRRLEECYVQDAELVEDDGQSLLFSDKHKLAERRANERQRADSILSGVYFGLNVILLFANLAAAIFSGSYSIMSTFLDSLMDISTSVIINVCLFLVANTNRQAYPRGRDRLEHVGVILCSVVMTLANLAMVFVSVESIVSDTINPDVTLPTATIMLVGAAVKVVLMVMCYRRRDSPSAQVLAMDMRNDLATTAVALVCAVLGDRVWKYLDPIGAICVCALIALSWLRNVLDSIPTMVGVGAEREQISRILRVVLAHDERIRFVDHIMVYHTGVKATVELHIVMDEHLPLKTTHDIAHPLEKKLKRLDFIERAFIHCDYYCDGD